MKVPRRQLRESSNSRRFSFAILKLSLVVLALSINFSNTQAQQDRTMESRKTLTIHGQVLMPDSKPATNVMVTVTNLSLGLNLEALTNDQGRFEFKDLKPGNYSFTAKSLTDPALSSGSIEVDASFVPTGRVSVNLRLNDNSSKVNDAPKSKTITVAELAQKIPKEAAKAFKQGVKFKEDNKLDQALKSFGRAIEIYPDYFQALTERGNVYIAQRRLTEAASDFDQAIKANTLYGQALRGAGYCKLEGKEFAQAVEYFERAISAEPDNASTYLLLGIARLELNQRDEARRALQQALKINALSAARAHIYLANLYALEHLYKEAADELHIYLELDPMAPDAAKLKEIEALWRARQARP
jgi:Flp pilus assembly protein TadD